MNDDRQLDALLEDMRRRIANDAAQAPTLSTLAREAGVTPSRLLRRFRARYGLTPAEYARSLRMQTLKSGLKRGARVTDATYDAGFGSGSRVYEHSNALLGMTPASYRRGARNVAIRFTTTDSVLGRLLVAATARGLCAVMLGTDDAELGARLRGEFPHALIDRVDAGRDEWLDGVITRVARDLGWCDRTLPPLDIAATAFQWRVWEALTRIPRGQTVGYGELAATLGSPRGARAIARACASNRLALIVPCHRVIREDGSLGGWRWGVDRKRRLLTRERAANDAHGKHRTVTTRR